jgi:hypothetical protein
MGAPDSPVHQPRHPIVRVLTISTVGVLTFWVTLSGAPSDGCSDSARTVRALCVVRRPLESTVALASCCSAGTPNSPVNYSGAWLQKPEGEELESIAPGAPDTVRWGTRLCPVAHRTVRCARPGFSSVSVAPFF